MTSKELEHIKLLRETLQDIKRSNETFYDCITQRIKKVEQKVEDKHLPVSLEGDILKTVQLSVHEAIKKCLTEYNSPLSKLVNRVVEDHTTELKNIFTEAFGTSIRTSDFKESIVSSFSHKIARSMMSMTDSLFEKVSNELKQDAAFKAKMVVAISNVVEECMKDKNETK